MSYEQKEPGVVEMNQAPPHYATPPPQAQGLYSQPQSQPQQYGAQSPPPQGYPQQQQYFQGSGQPPHQNSMGSVPQMQQTTSQGQRFQNTTPLPSLQSGPAPVQCPSCGQQAMTRTNFVTGNTTHAWGLGLFLTTCCCCIPYMINGTKDVTHNCGNCGAQLATWHRSGRTEVHMHA